jgi:ribosomal protein L7/L12
VDLTTVLIIIVVLPAALLVGAILRSTNQDHRADMRSAQPSADIEALVHPLLCAPRPNKVMAIKLVRERTGMGLREAKEYVDALAQTIPSHATGASRWDEARARQTHQDAAEMVSSMRAAGDDRIEAIKRVQSTTGLTLKESKAFVDALWP